MVLSKYTVVVNQCPDLGYHAIYNIIHGSLCIVDDSLFCEINASSDIQELKHNLTLDEYRSLKSLKLLKKINEEDWCLSYIHRLMTNKHDLNLILYMTERCNLACQYCFQPDVHRVKPRTMTKDVALQLIAWMKAFCTKQDIRRICTIFYGGEPLLSKDILMYIADNQAQIAKNAGLKSRFIITTNGTLPLNDLFLHLNCSCPTEVQITLDGQCETHNKRRPFIKDNHGSFNCIISNLIQLSEITSNITLRVNFDNNNINEVPLLIDSIQRLGLERKVKFFFMPVSLPKQDWGRKIDLVDGDALIKILLEYYKIAEDMELTIIPYYASGVCQFFGNYSYSITPDGSIYKCPNLIENRFRVGDIYKGVIEVKNFQARQLSFEECLSCKYLPICAKGCRHQAYMRNRGNINVKFCEKKLLNKLMEFYVKQYVLQGLD